MAADPKKVALYSQNTFDVPNPTNEQIDKMIAAANDIAYSGFGTVLLGQWHVHSDGTIYYNNSKLDTVIQALKVIPTALGQGGIVKEVLISFGPFGSDFQGIKDNLSQFKKTMEGVVAQTAVQGFDWDLEQDYSDFTDLIVDLTEWANGLGLIVTAAPYQANSFWTDVLKQTNTGGSSGFAWWNLQLYGGAAYSQWVGYLKGLVPDPQSFLVPGYSVSFGATPHSVQDNLTSLRDNFPSLDGGFIWQYEDIQSSAYTTKQYATGIKNGL